MNVFIVGSPLETAMALKLMNYGRIIKRLGCDM